LQYHGGGAPRISAVILLIAEDISSIAKQNSEKTKQTNLSIGTAFWAVPAYFHLCF